MDSVKGTPQDIGAETEASAGTDLPVAPTDNPNGRQEPWGTEAPHAWFRSVIRFRRCDWP
jgi:hypothetical protein